MAVLPMRFSSFIGPDFSDFLVMVMCIVYLLAFLLRFDLKELILTEMGEAFAQESTSTVAVPNEYVS